MLGYFVDVGELGVLVFLRFRRGWFVGRCWRFFFSYIKILRFNIRVCEESIS